MGAYVIAVCGAGGKSTYIKKRAEEFAGQGKRVVVTTTTHIFNEKNYSPFKNIELRGTELQDGKLGPLEAEEYKKCCEYADVVLVEADGSRRMPIKVPAEYEPVIPENADEITVVMGAHAMGRRLATVCHRFELIKGEYSGEETVDMKLIRTLAEKYYLAPLRKKYPKKKTEFYLSDMRRDFMERAGTEKKLCVNLVLLASGFGKRFGKNKLMEPYKGKPLYLNTLDNIAGAVRKLKAGFETAGTDFEKTFDLSFFITVVSRYGEILESDYGRRYEDICPVKAVYNPDYEEGISGSLRKGVEISRLEGADATVFFVADMPELDSETIAYFTALYICSGKQNAAMYAGGHMSNPGALSRRYYNEIRKLRGDKGCMSIIKSRPEEVFIFQTEEAKLRDVDKPEDVLRG